MISVAPSPDPDLVVALENRLEPRIPAGFQGALFCFGHCFHRHATVVGLELVVDGTPHRPSAFGMPRRDLYAWLRAGGGISPGSRPIDPEGRSYRSGFWATLPIIARSVPGWVELEAVARLEGGDEVRRPLARLQVVAPEPPPPRRAADGTIAICLATFEPDLTLLETQLDSIRTQLDERWICLVSDGGSSPQRFDQVRELIGSDTRFTVSRASVRLDPYRNFERALKMVPAGVELIALCDQDDRWYPHKLQTLRDAIGDAQLVYSDQRLVTPDGYVVRESLWEGRRNDYRNLASLLVANTMSGAAMLLRRRVLEMAMPFPQTPAVQYHDHWLALVALASGEVRYVDQPLYDWVQHPGAVTSAARASDVSRWRAAYFCGVVPRQVQALTLLLRCGAVMPARKRRALRWFLASDRSPAHFIWLTLRPLRRLAGRGETMGTELTLVRGIVWEWLLSLAVRPLGRRPRLRVDACFPDPPAFDQPRLRRWRTGR
jgi:hypothetical protein